MAGSQEGVSRQTPWGVLAIGVAALLVVGTAPGRALAGRFLASLRLGRPQSVSVALASPGPNAGRSLQNALGGMVGTDVGVSLDEPDQPVPGVDSASRLAGFAARLPRARTDAPSLTVTGAHTVDMRVNPAQVRTIVAEAGRPPVALPASLQGATLSIRTPRGIRASYGHCPEPAAATLQGQLQGPPPPSTDNGDCVVLVESPTVDATIPAGFDLEPLVEIALELSGMSPNQAQAFRQRFDWKAALALSLPRFMRSYDSVEVGNASGMLLNTVGRRGPTWTLLWTADGMVYAMAGYGIAADAKALAASVR